MVLTFVGARQLEGDVRTFIFKSEDINTWIPGQFLHLTLKHQDEDNRGDKRWFTIASAPSDGELTISTRIVADNPSSFKQKLAMLKPGDTLEADGPEGDFILVDANRNYIFIAGGIGITPFHSIIKEAATKHQMPNVRLLYANRTADIAFGQEFKNIQKDNPALKIKFITSPQRIDKSLLQKTIQETEKPIIYVSGPEPMVEDFVRVLYELDVKETDIKTDYFPGYKAF